MTTGNDIGQNAHGVMGHIADLRIYPVKSCRGVSVDEAPLGRRGLRWDRRYMVTDHFGIYLTQRDFPKLALVDVALSSHAGKPTFTVSAPGLPDLVLPASGFEQDPTCFGDMMHVDIWTSENYARRHQAGCEWFSKFLGDDCRFVYMPDTEIRPVDPDYAAPGDIVGFADGFPVLLTNEASMEDLRLRMAQNEPATGERVEMDRFRTNVLVTGLPAWDEDLMARFQLGDLQFRGPKLCERCKVTTVDPENPDFGKEPLRTLATFRRRDNKVWFGLNAIPDGEGVLRKGDPLRILERRPPFAFNTAP